MVLITVYKDRSRYEKDLRKSFLKIRAQSNIKRDDVWALAKEDVSKIDFSQKVNVSDTFFIKKSPKEIKDDVYALGADIAQGRRFKVKLSQNV